MIDILKGQSLADIAIQETGSLENLIALAIENNVPVTDSLEDMPQVSIPVEVNTSKSVLAYYRARGLKPATNLEQFPGGEGVEYWIIERDFVVS